MDELRVLDGRVQLQVVQGDQGSGSGLVWSEGRPLCRRDKNTQKGGADEDGGDDKKGYCAG